MTSNGSSPDSAAAPVSRRMVYEAWFVRALLALVLALGAYVRCVGLFTWDEPSFRLHPDERFMVQVATDIRLPTSFAQYVDSSVNPLNPRNANHSFYVYGMLPEALTRLTAVVLTPDSALPFDSTERWVPEVRLLQRLLNPHDLNLTDYYQIYKVGRTYSMLFDLGSMVMVFLIGRRLFGRRVGVLAALLLALSVLPIQLAHFFTVDATTAFFTLLSVYWAIRVAQGGGVGSYVAVGVSIGAAMACRVTLGTLAVLAVLAVVQDVGWLERGGRRGVVRVLRSGGLLVLAGVIALLVFRMAQPDAFVGSSFFDLRPEPRFLDNIRSIADQVSGVQDAPPGQQWVGRVPFVFSLTNMVIWGMGVPLGVMAWGAWVVAGWQVLRRRVLVSLIPWAWVGFYFVWQGGQFVMTMRYYALLYGLLAVFAAWGLVACWRWGWRVVGVDGGASAGGWRWVRWWGGMCGRWAWVVVVVATLCWAYAFTRIYTRPHSRIAASRWIYEHIPPGSVITSEAWDDGLPLDLDGRRATEYVGLQTQPYGEDDPEKYTGAAKPDGSLSIGLFDQLDQADYVILSSNRVYGSATRLPMRYPALTRYYHYLFTGELGFTLVADITSYPTLFGVPIPDQGAEEAFSVYDHPRVLIFKKTVGYTRARVEQLIAGDVAWNEVYKLPTVRADKVPTALRLTEDVWPEYRSGGTWTALFSGSSLVALVPWLVWLLVLEVIGAAMFLLLFGVLPGLADRGFALAKTLGLVVVAYGAWLLGSLNVMSFRPASVWVCTAVLLVMGALVGWRRWGEVRVFVRRRRAALAVAEGLFLLAFGVFLVIRVLNPDLWHPARGGEKPMDLAFLTAVLKSAAFPPYDPWFAGGYINYYYFGFVLVGTLVHLTGVVPTVAYNIAVPTVFALTALGAWGAVYNVLARRVLSLGEGVVGQARVRERRAMVVGVVAAIFVVVLGNLAQAGWFLPGSAVEDDPGIDVACRGVRSYAAQQACRGRDEWAFWDATRIVGTSLHDGTITEFPFFTFLYGDLHAHLIALALALAALGLMVGLAYQAAVVLRRKGGGKVLFGAVGPPLVLLALVVGALRATNTWDFPTYAGLVLLTLALAAWDAYRHDVPLWWLLGRWLGLSVGFVVLTVVLFLPFTAHFATDYAGFEVWRGTHTGALDFLKIHGVWLVLLVGAVLRLYRRVMGVGWVGLGAMAGGVAVVAVVAVWRGWPALVLIGPLVLLVGALGVEVVWGGRRGGGVGVMTLLPGVWMVSALGLTLMMEVVVAKGDIGRMNTVFKFGMQSWVLFALSSAVAVGWLWEASGRWLRSRRRVVVAGGWVWRLLAVGVIAAALVYPVTATPARLADRFDRGIGPTLDGAAFMRAGSWAENGVSFDFRQDAAAMAWMREHVAGTPIVLEAHTEAYRWGGRVSTYTGLPTLLGWPWHETQQRSVAQVGPVLGARQNVIAQLYNSSVPTETLRLLRLYGVEYVYVGLLERALYDPVGLATFDDLVRDGRVALVYSADETRIYHVPPSEHAPALLTTSLPVRAPVLPMGAGPMLDVPVYQLPALGDFAWNRLADMPLVALVLWLLVGYGLVLLGLPVAWAVFGRWRDAGYAWSRLIGLLLLGYAVWMPVSMRLWAYSRLALVLGVVVVLVFDGVVVYGRGRWLRATVPGAQGGAGPLSLGAAELWAGLVARRRSIAVVELLFVVAFGFMTGLRFLNPDLWHPIWGGEKPFEFGFLNAILRSPVMPPYDPFFSGGTINYYYYGLFLVSLPMRAIGVAPAVGFNLVIPWLFALTVVASFALVAELTGRVRFGVVAAVLVALAGNLASIFQVGWSQGLSPVLGALPGGWEGFGRRLGDWFIGPSRVIPNTINEFPFWSFLFADLHPHVIALPITILAIALVYRLFYAEGVLQWGGGAWVGYGVAALTLGTLAVTNSWDFPTYVLLLGGGLVGQAWRACGVSEGLVRRLLAAVVVAGAIAGGALVLYLPFFQHYQALVQGVGVVSDGTMLRDYVLIYGVSLVVLVPFVFGAAWRLLRVRVGRSGVQPSADASVVSIEGAVRAPVHARWRGSLRLGLVVVPVLCVIVAFVLPMVGLRLWLGLVLVVGVGALLSRRATAATWFVLWMAVVGWAVSLGMDVVFVRDHLAGGEWYRMNTVFKFGMQVWVLLALAAAAALPLVVRGLRRVGVLPLVGGTVVFGGVLVVALVFPLVGVPSRVGYRFATPPAPTLDGLAFMRSGVFDWNGTLIDLRADGEAIDWLNRSIDGTPIVLQSSLEFYRAYGIRVAANTGLPTVVGALHENEQRDGELVAERDRDVSAIYTTTDQEAALRLLAKYHVGYVYIGAIERAAYGDAGLAKFDALNGFYFEQVYSNDGVKIFHVDEKVYSIAALPSVPLPDVAQRPPQSPPPVSRPGQPTLESLERQVAANPSATGPAFALAQRYREMGRLDEAADMLRVPAVAHPEDVALHHLWGDILRDAGRLDEAESAYRAAAAAGPTAGNYNKLGAELLKMGRFDAAEAVLQQALVVNGDEPEPHVHLGEIYEVRGQQERAIEEYRTYLRLAAADGVFREQASAAIERMTK